MIGYLAPLSALAASAGDPVPISIIFGFVGALVGAIGAFIVNKQGADTERINAVWGRLDRVEKAAQQVPLLRAQVEALTSYVYELRGLLPEAERPPLRWPLIERRTSPEGMLTTAELEIPEVIQIDKDEE